MAEYHVSFWSGDRAHVVGCDLKPAGERALDDFARAGRYALSLRRRSLIEGDPAECSPSAAELLWLAFLCGPAWLFVAASYWLSAAA